MSIRFTFLQLIASVRCLQLLYKADLIVKTLKGIIKCMLEMEHNLSSEVLSTGLWLDCRMLMASTI